jgi:transcriptional regulator
MYTPKHFSKDSKSEVRDVIAQNSFATVLSYPKDQTVLISHLPIIFSANPAEENILIGHMARQNPQWKHFRDNPNATMIFHGPHTYISPLWYRSGRDVPTWNYAVVHLHGKIELVEKFDEQVEILKQLTAVFEGPTGWDFELPDDLLDESALTSAIISFKFHIEKTEAKFKLSQNRSKDDREGIIEGLKTRTDEQSKLVREMMLKNEE